MALLKATRSAQRPLVAEFIFNYNDTAADTVDGTTKTFGSTFGQTLVFDSINLPRGAVICGGEVLVETAWATSTAATISVGVSGATTALASSVDLKTATRTALTLTTTAPYVSNTGLNIRITVNATVANATAGKGRVRVMFTIDDRADEVYPS